ncbi:MAG: ClcB-like voltage-gated chloride channel protein [Verrucomicrobium sp.]|nr:ClcB-like voltage-gated chloride channel protein [Verrucomicrobium sp.]
MDGSASNKPFLLKAWLGLRLWLAEKARPTELQITLLWAGVVGFAGGMASILFRRGLKAVQLLLTHQKGDLLLSSIRFPWWERLLLPPLGGLLAGALLYYGTRLLRGQSSGDYMEAVVLGDGVVPARPTLVKSLSSLFTISSGGSIGREGPMVQLSAMLASLLGRRCGLSTTRLQLLVACGAAAGIASAYNAPIGGALFVAEIVLGSIAMESFGPLAFASVVATLTVQRVFGGRPVFEVDGFELVSNWEMVPYLFLGLLAGFLAPPFLDLLERSERLFSRLPPNPMFRLALGGLAVGLLSLLTTGVWGNGYEVVNAILHLSLIWQAVLLVLVLKVIATAATVGSGAVGGVFTPTLFVGAALGLLFGTPFHALWPEHVAYPNAYALVGMGCFLAATTHAPLMAIVMLFEMTLDHAIILPLMVACVTAHYTSQGLRRRSIYAAALLRKRAAIPALPAGVLRVRDLLKADPPRVPENAHFAEIARAFASHRYNFLYVVDARGRFRGAIALHDIKAYLHQPDLAGPVVAADLLRDDFPRLTPDEFLAEALGVFARHEGDRLPVVASREEPVLLGTLSKNDLLLSLAHAPAAGREAAGMPAA